MDSGRATSIGYLSAKHVVTSREAELTIEPPSGNFITSLSLASPRAVGGDLVTATIALDDDAPSGGAEVTSTSSAPSVAAVPASATVGQGNDSITFDVDTDAVTAAGDVWITATYNGVNQRVRLTVVPTSPTVTLESLSVPENVARGESLTGSVTLSGAAPSGGITVTLTGSRAGIATIPASVTVPLGETSAEFTITTNASSPVQRGVHVTAALETLVRDRWFVVNNGLEARTPRQKPSTETKLAGTTGRRSEYERRTFLPSHPVAHSLAASQQSRRLIPTTTDPLQRFYLYTPELNLLAETELTTDSDPQIQYEYLWFAGQPVAQIETATNEIAWYFNDHLGTPILQTDASGDVVWRVEREPYGKIYEVRAGAERHQPLAFPGQEEQGGETTYNIFRWYRAGWGRYTQADPIKLRGGLNLFEYAASSPARAIDPLGLFCTKDFVWHYFFGFYKGIDLGSVGLLDEYVASAAGQMDSVRSAMNKMASDKAKTLCAGCGKGVQSGSVDFGDSIYHQVTSGCLFQMGSTMLGVTGACGVKANCATKTFTADCTSNWKLRDWFVDPLSVYEVYGDIGLAFEPGKPYPITGDWANQWKTGGSF